MADLNDILRARTYKVIIDETEFDQIFDERQKAFESFQGRADGQFDKLIEVVITQLHSAKTLERRIGNKIEKAISIFDGSVASYLSHLNENIFPKQPRTESDEMNARLDETDRLTKGFIEHIFDQSIDHEDMELGPYIDDYFSHKDDIERTTLKQAITMQMMGLNFVKSKVEIASLFFKAVTVYRHLLYSQIIGIHGKGLEKGIMATEYKHSLLEAIASPISGLTALAQFHQTLEKRKELADDPASVFKKFENENRKLKTYLVDYATLLQEWTSHMKLLLPEVNRMAKSLK